MISKEKIIPARIWGFRRSALLEVFLFLLAALSVDILFLDGNRFAQVSPHPFWILVVLISTQYGTREGLLAAVAACIARLAGNMPAPTLAQDNYSYMISVIGQPLLWFLAAIVMGELRMRHVREREQLLKELVETKEREVAITDSHHKMSAVKERLEARVATQMRSVLTAYRAAQAIEKLDPGEVLKGLMDVIRTVMNPTKFSLFLLRKSSLELFMQEGWSDSDSYSQVYFPESFLYREVIGRHRILCLANEDDERVLNGEGVLAGPIFCAMTGEMIGLLKIESMSFLDLNISNVQAFRSLCDWVANTYANARRYQLAKNDSLVNSDTQLYSYTFFQRQVDFLTSLAKRFGFDLSLMILRLDNGNGLDAKVREQIPTMIDRTVKKSLRKTDLVFDFQRAGVEFAFVLPGNSVENSQVLVDKLIADMKMRVREAQFSATCLSLHHAYPEVGRLVKELLPQHKAAFELMAQ